MAFAICPDRICSERVELAITKKIHFLLDSIFSTNVCVGTYFMDVDVSMHKLETEREHILHVKRKKYKVHFLKTFVHFIRQKLYILRVFQEET